MNQVASMFAAQEVISLNEDYSVNVYMLDSRNHWNKWVFACDAAACENGYTPYVWNYEGMCFKCEGKGYVGKVYPDFASIKKVAIERLKNREAYARKRDAKEAVERAARAEEAAIAAAEHEAKVAQVEAEKASWVYADVMNDVGWAFSGVVTDIIEFDNNFGGSSVFVGVDDKANMVKYGFYSTAKFAFNLEKGDNVSLVGIVSNKQERDGYKRTMLKRVKVVK